MNTKYPFSANQVLRSKPIRISWLSFFCFVPLCSLLVMWAVRIMHRYKKKKIEENYIFWTTFTSSIFFSVRYTARVSQLTGTENTREYVTCVLFDRFTRTAVRKLDIRVASFPPASPFHDPSLCLALAHTLARGWLSNVRCLRQFSLFEVM